MRCEGAFNANGACWRQPVLSHPDSGTGTGTGTGTGRRDAAFPFPYPFPYPFPIFFFDGGLQGSAPSRFLDTSSLPRRRGPLAHEVVLDLPRHAPEGSL